MKTYGNHKVGTRWLTIGLIIASLLFAVACSPRSAPGEAGTTPAANNDSNSPKLVTVQGSVRVVVDELLYNYSVDEETPLAAYVHEFQSRPYIIHFKEDQAGWFEKGQAFDITFEDLALTPEVSLLYRSDPEFFLSLTNAQKISLFNLQIKSCAVFEGEMGMDHDHGIRFAD